MNILLLLAIPIWLSALILFLSILKVSGDCSQQEQMQKDKRLFEKQGKDSGCATTYAVRKANHVLRSD
jgi:hypothetical protein